MDENFLHLLRREPRPEFRRDLRDRLTACGEPRRSFGAVAAPWAAVAAAVMVVAALFVFPSVRASAQSMLDLFRVRTFAAIEFDESRLDKLKSLKQDNALMVFDRQEVVREPGPSVTYPTSAAAGAAAGLALREPGYLPNGLGLDSVIVNGAGEARLSVSEAKLRALLDQLDLGDVNVPGGLDGQWIEVRKPPAVIQCFHGGRAQATLAQALSPEVSVPPGLDVVQLAEVGLRVLGLDPGEARRVARATDWRTTLLVPVPMNASTFRQVTINGRPGLLITTAAMPTRDGNRRREGTLVLWTQDDRVFGLRTTLGDSEAMQIAESVR
jgi:hypothetical protein